MSLAPGVRLGAYQVLALIGAGGMGEVYRARDPRLGRDVAIKVLPTAFSVDPDRLHRFEQEARAAAALNHPNILAVYDLGQHDGAPFIITELLEGETLRERLAASFNADGAPPFEGAWLPVRRAIEYAVQIARGLAAAHEKGIVHRDLKPENIFVTSDGRVKILDFGLAKLMERDPASASLSTIPTAAPHTTPGVVLGTIGYMSPEQVRGLTADHRSDIFAFGAILYEMLAGRHAFAGATTADTLTAILKEDPPRLPTADRHIPPGLARIVDRCLEKSSAARFKSADDLAFALEGLSAHSDVGVSAPVVNVVDRQVFRGNARLAWTLVALLSVVSIAALAFGVVANLRGAAILPPSIRLSVAPPQNATFFAVAGASIPAVSPDGRRVAFVAIRAGVPLLWVRSLDLLEAQPLPGTDGASFPFWSPNSRALGFFAGGMLKTIDASGGPVRALCDASNIRGGAWSPEGVIVFGAQSGGLSTVSASGGSAAPLTSLDAAHEERAHRFPSFLPDGRHYLYSAGPPNTIVLGSLDSKETTRLLTADSQAVYVAPGSLLFVRQGTLVAQPFDARRGALTGEALPIAEQVLPDSSGAAAFDGSLSGVLAYRMGTIDGPTQLTWVDRAGTPLGTVGQPGRYRNPALSPNDTRLAVEAVDPLGRTEDIWLMELARGVASRFTFDPGNDIYPVWSPDGTRIIFASDRGGGTFNMYQKRGDGAGSEELVLKSNADMLPYSWSPDGRFVVYRTSAQTPFNMGILPLVGKRSSTDSRPEPPEGHAPHLFFEPSRFNPVAGQVSPDGRWLAYASDESGRNEIYVQSFPAPGGGKWQISKDGGFHARWRRDGHELFYYALDGRLMAVPVLGTTGLGVGAAIPLFEAHLLNGPRPAGGFRQQYDVARDGRFLLNVPVEDVTAASITVVVNWEAGLKK